MSTDAGAVTEGEVVVTLGGTHKGLDTALGVRTSWSGRFFTEFKVLKLIAKPRLIRVRSSECEQEGWRGDLEPYYAPPEVPSG